MDSTDTPPECPKYRVRLFLSVDLTNSTAFKSSRAPHVWVPIFRDFYSEFSDTFRRKFIKVVECAKDAIENISDDDIESLKNREPNFWKTVGDEIIYVNRVDSCFEVFLMVKAFSEALKEYGATLAGEKETESLGVKGAGWLASFPYPNIAIEMPKHSVHGNGGISEREEIERSADKDPSQHEFLGKGLDYGFRIAGNAANDFLAISPALALIISRANVNEDYSAIGTKIKVKPPVKLKGVLNGKDYPVVGIPIDKTDEWTEFREVQDKLLGSDQSNAQELRDYLKLFVKLNDIEEPCLRVRPQDAPVNAPQYYKEKYVPKWVAVQKEVEAQDEMISSGNELEEEGNEVPTSAAVQDVITAFIKALPKKP